MSIRKALSRRLHATATKRAAVIRGASASSLASESACEALVLYVPGTGCALKPRKMEELERELREAAGPRVRVAVRCNPAALAPLPNIARTACSLPPASSTAFVSGLASEVAAVLNGGGRVLLMGHSYGGSVASRLAEAFAEHPAAADLRVVTLGTIYASPRSTTGGVDVLHVVREGDVAVRCSSLGGLLPPSALRQPRTVTTPEGLRVRWLPAGDLPLPSQPSRPGALGKKGWDLHVSYAPYRQRLVRDTLGWLRRGGRTCRFRPSA